MPYQYTCKHCGKAFLSRRTDRSTFCSRECGFAHRRLGDPERFWSQVDRTGGCWLWTGARGSDGRGRVSYEGRLWLAHRLAYTLTNGVISESCILVQQCSVTNCVNPAHLVPSTFAEINQRHRASAGRFWARVDRRGPDECWEWTGYRLRLGYGRLTYHGRTTAAHRLAYAFAHGPIPEGLFICHRCDNPPCCNPAHLFLGTVADNNADMRAKGRHRTGDQHPLRLHPECCARGDRSGARTHPERLRRGSAAGPAKLTDDQVRAIRTRWEQGGISQRVLGRAYGVSPSHISGIVHRRFWTHI